MTVVLEYFPVHFAHGISCEVPLRSDYAAGFIPLGVYLGERLFVNMFIGSGGPACGEEYCDLGAEAGMKSRSWKGPLEWMSLSCLRWMASGST